MQVHFVTDDGQKQTLQANAKTFSTGSTGYHGGGKIEIDGERYQVSCSIVKVGSKPNAK